MIAISIRTNIKRKVSMESIYDDSTSLNHFASFKHTGSYADVIYPGKEVLQDSNTWRLHRKESSMKSDSINRLILDYSVTEDRK